MSVLMTCRCDTLDHCRVTLFTLNLKFDIQLTVVGQISPLQRLFHEKMFGSLRGRYSYWLKPSITSCQEAVLIRDS